MIIGSERAPPFSIAKGLGAIGELGKEIGRAPSMSIVEGLGTIEKIGKDIGRAWVAVSITTRKKCFSKKNAR